MKNIYFIIKPLSPSKLKRLESLIKTTFKEESITLFLWNSLYKGHAIELSKKAVNEKADVIVACGGDGTINEVAQTMVHSAIPLGIIPLGSGNGLARHLKISLNNAKAVHNILIKKTVPFDVGSVNDNYFFCNMGIGFEARFIQQYGKNKSHGSWAYFIAFMNALSVFKRPEILVEYQGVKKKMEPFIFMLSNTNQQGYNFSITRDTKSDDGKLKMVWMEKSSWLSLLQFAAQVLFCERIKLKKFNSISVKELKVTPNNAKKICMQIDGEHLPLKDDFLKITTLKHALEVIVPVE